MFSLLHRFRIVFILARLGGLILLVLSLASLIEDVGDLWLRLTVWTVRVSRTGNMLDVFAFWRWDSTVDSVIRRSPTTQLMEKGWVSTVSMRFDGGKNWRYGLYGFLKLWDREGLMIVSFACAVTLEFLLITYVVTVMCQTVVILTTPRRGGTPLSTTTTTSASTTTTIGSSSSPSGSAGAAATGVDLRGGGTRAAVPTLATKSLVAAARQSASASSSIAPRVPPLALPSAVAAASGTGGSEGLREPALTSSYVDTPPPCESPTVADAPNAAASSVTAAPTANAKGNNNTDLNGRGGPTAVATHDAAVTAGERRRRRKRATAVRHILVLSPRRGGDGMGGAAAMMMSSAAAFHRHIAMVGNDDDDGDDLLVTSPSSHRVAQHSASEAFVSDDATHGDGDDGVVTFKKGRPLPPLHEVAARGRKGDGAGPRRRRDSNPSASALPPFPVKLPWMLSFFQWLSALNVASHRSFITQPWRQSATQIRHWLSLATSQGHAWLLYYGGGLLEELSHATPLIVHVHRAWSPLNIYMKALAILTTMAVFNVDVGSGVVRHMAASLNQELCLTTADIHLPWDDARGAGEAPSLRRKSLSTQTGSSSSMSSRGGLLRDSDDLTSMASGGAFPHTTFESTFHNLTQRTGHIHIITAMPNSGVSTSLRRAIHFRRGFYCDVHQSSRVFAVDGYAASGQSTPSPSFPVGSASSMMPPRDSSMTYPGGGNVNIAALYHQLYECTKPHAFFESLPPSLRTLLRITMSNPLIQWSPETDWDDTLIEAFARLPRFGSGAGASAVFDTDEDHDIEETEYDPILSKKFELLSLRSVPIFVLDGVKAAAALDQSPHLLQLLRRVSRFAHVVISTSDEQVAHEAYQRLASSDQSVSLLEFPPMARVDAERVYAAAYVSLLQRGEDAMTLLVGAPPTTPTSTPTTTTSPTAASSSSPPVDDDDVPTASSGGSRRSPLFYDHHGGGGGGGGGGREFVESQREVDWSQLYATLTTTTGMAWLDEIILAEPLLAAAAPRVMPSSSSWAFAALSRHVRHLAVRSFDDFGGYFTHLNDIRQRYEGLLVLHAQHRDWIRSSTRTLGNKLLQDAAAIISHKKVAHDRRQTEEITEGDKQRFRRSRIITLIALLEQAIRDERLSAEATLGVALSAHIATAEWLLTPSVRGSVDNDDGSAKDNRITLGEVPDEIDQVTAGSTATAGLHPSRRHRRRRRWATVEVSQEALHQLSRAPALHLALDSFAFLARVYQTGALLAAAASAPASSSSASSSSAVSHDQRDGSSASDAARPSASHDAPRQIRGTAAALLQRGLCDELQRGVFFSHDAVPAESRGDEDTSTLSQPFSLSQWLSASQVPHNTIALQHRPLLRAVTLPLRCECGGEEEGQSTPEAPQRGVAPRDDRGGGESDTSPCSLSFRYFRFRTPLHERVFTSALHRRLGEFYATLVRELRVTITMTMSNASAAVPTTSGTDAEVVEVDSVKGEGSERRVRPRLMKEDDHRRALARAMHAAVHNGTCCSASSCPASPSSSSSSAPAARCLTTTERWLLSKLLRMPEYNFLDWIHA